MIEAISGIFDTGPNSVIFWQSICWVLWGFILFITPLASKYLLSKKEDEQLILDIKDQLKIITDLKTILSSVEKYLAILHDREGHRPRIIEDETKPPQVLHDETYVKIAGKMVKVRDIENILNLADTQPRPIDKY